MGVVPGELVVTGRLVNFTPARLASACSYKSTQARGPGVLGFTSSTLPLILLLQPKGSRPASLDFT